MNKYKRSRLEKAINLLGSASEIISDVKYDEQDSMNNIPENLQGSDRYSDMEDAVDNMEDALDLISEIEDLLEEAVSKINKAIEIVDEAAA